MARWEFVPAFAGAPRQREPWTVNDDEAKEALEFVRRIVDSGAEITETADGWILRWPHPVNEAPSPHDVVIEGTYELTVPRHALEAWWNPPGVTGKQLDKRRGYLVIEQLEFFANHFPNNGPVLFTAGGFDVPDDPAHRVAEFERALEPVLRDLRATAGPLPSSIGPLYEHSGFSLIRNFDGDHGSRGIRMPTRTTLPEQIAFVADEVQEWAIEENWGKNSNWPKCPKHPTTHPLEAVVLGGYAVWRCPEARESVARIGSLVEWNPREDEGLDSPGMTQD